MNGEQKEVFFFAEMMSFSDMNITSRTKKDDNEGMTLLEEQVVWSLKYKCYGFNPMGWKKDGRRVVVHVIGIGQYNSVDTLEVKYICKLLEWTLVLVLVEIQEE